MPQKPHKFQKPQVLSLPLYHVNCLIFLHEDNTIMCALLSSTLLYIPGILVHVVRVECIERGGDFACRGILVLIDGAHSLGQLALDIKQLDVDVYVTNCHKWFCNTRGSALMYVRRELQPQIRPLSVSWGHDRGFVAEFAWAGQSHAPIFAFFVALLYWYSFYVYG